MTARAPVSELAIQTDFRARARMQCPAVLIVAVPNAGKRGLGAQRQVKQEGLASGFPDVVCLWPGAGLAAIEFKSALGVVSANQLEWQVRLYDYGFPATISRSADHALAFLRAAGAPFSDREGRL